MSLERRHRDYSNKDKRASAKKEIGETLNMQSKDFLNSVYLPAYF